MQSLNPIDFKEDIEKYEAKEIKAAISFSSCKHKNTQLNETRTELKCTCGRAWGGSRLGELKEALDKN